MEVRGASYILTYEYNYKVITGCAQYYKNIISPIGANARRKRYTIMNCTKEHSLVTEEKLERRVEIRKDRVSQYRRENI